MAEGASVGLRINFDAVPLISCAKKHANAYRFPGGAFDNRLHYGQWIDFDPAIPEAYQMLLYDPQTSGGLLLGVPEAKIESYMAAAKAKDEPAWLVGEVIAGDRITVRG